MRQLIGFCIITLVIFSCSDKTSQVTKINNASNSARLYLPSYPVNKFEGSYSGAFSKGFITINLNYVQGKTASGYEIQRGVRRNLNGTLQPNGKSFLFTMKEPGTETSDGIFQFSIDTSRFILNGTWKSMDTSVIASIPVSLKKQPTKTEANYENELGTWLPQKGAFRKDTTLDFSPLGICEYKFYQFPGDSTSHIISVKGSYIRNKDSVFIDWQKNSWTPILKMKLIRMDVKVPHKEYDEEHLVGHGWNLVKVEAD